MNPLLYSNSSSPSIVPVDDWKSLAPEQHWGTLWGHPIGYAWGSHLILNVQDSYVSC